MNTVNCVFMLAIVFTGVFALPAFAQNPSVSVKASVGETPPALTIYNQGFGVVRETLGLNLSDGENRITFDGATAHLEPDSVVLRDPSGKRILRILEQNYEGDPLSQELLLSKYEGQNLSFIVNTSVGFGPAPSVPERIVTGKVIRSGYVPHTRAMNRYGSAYAQGQYGFSQGGGNQPIIEIDGKLRFGLPGTPIFPSLGENAILKPTLSWTLASDKSGPLEAEISYVTGGMSWEADYNLVAPAVGDTLELMGLVTIDNQSGRSFDNAHLKLMAGDVSKIQQNQGGYGGGGGFGGLRLADASASIPSVTEKTFDEYHLYILERPTTLRDRETKQVEFVRSDGIISKRIYVYDGFRFNPGQNYNDDYRRQQREYGTASNPKVWVMREFVNSKENRLGIPLPKGRVRFYRRDDKGGALEFVGENVIDHTPQGETLRVYTGDAFDVVGERRQVRFTLAPSGTSADETFEIKVRNRKTEPVTVRVLEHLYRWANWEITEKSDEYTKKDSRNIEFPVTIAPDQEKVITYTVHYSW